MTNLFAKVHHCEDGIEISEFEPIFIDKNQWRSNHRIYKSINKRLNKDKATDQGLDLDNMYSPPPYGEIEHEDDDTRNRPAYYTKLDSKYRVVINIPECRGTRMIYTHNGCFFPDNNLLIPMDFTGIFHVTKSKLDKNFTLVFHKKHRSKPFLLKYLTNMFTCSDM